MSNWAWGQELIQCTKAINNDANCCTGETNTGITSAAIAVGSIKVSSARIIAERVSGASKGAAIRLLTSAYKGTDPKCRICRGRVQSSAATGTDRAGAKTRIQR
ncbi:hypothetical protein WB44_00710 [Synechococcus sp. WH 8020]|nr:hypothetical protein WB44_00710 [Synechococcus sp. WH 8020]